MPLPRVSAHRLAPGSHDVDADRNGELNVKAFRFGNVYPNLIHLWFKTREAWYITVRRDFVVPVNKERREMVN